MKTDEIKALLLPSGEWVDVRYGSVRLIPAVLVDTNTPGDSQSVLVDGSQTFLEHRTDNTLAMGAVTPQLLRFQVPHRDDRVFVVNPNAVAAWQLNETVELQHADQLPPSAVDLTVDHRHLEQDTAQARRPVGQQQGKSKQPPRRR